MSINDYGFMGSCEIKISGSSFGVVEFLKSSNLKPKTIWKRGEIPSIEKDPHHDSGFLFIISDEADKPISFYLKEATRFLAVQEPELNRAKRCGAEDFRLIIALNHAGSAIEYLPPKLLLLAGRLDIGIELAY